MKLKIGDHLDLANLNLPGAEGICAESEYFGIHNIVGNQIYTDNISIVCPPDVEIEETDPGVFKFSKPDSLQVWVW